MEPPRGVIRKDVHNLLEFFLKICCSPCFALSFSNYVKVCHNNNSILEVTRLMDRI